MGFFGTLSKIFQGKPVFEVDQNRQGASPESSAPGGVPVAGAAPSGPKVYPQAYIEHVECHESGDDIDCDVTVQNYSQGDVEIDKIQVFGRRTELDTHLRPGEEHDFRIYSGDKFKTNNQTSCLLYYKDASGDYFCSEHYIEFRQEPDRTYTIDRIRFMRVLDV